MNRTEWQVIYREFRVSTEKWIRCLLQNKKAADRAWNNGAGLAKFDFIHQMRRPDPLAKK